MYHRASPWKHFQGPPTSYALWALHLMLPVWSKHFHGPPTPYALWALRLMLPVWIQTFPRPSHTVCIMGSAPHAPSRIPHAPSLNPNISSALPHRMHYGLCASCSQSDAKHFLTRSMEAIALCCLREAQVQCTLINSRRFVFVLAEVVEHTCNITALQLGESLPSIAKDMDTYTMRVPLGVCAGITP